MRNLDMLHCISPVNSRNLIFLFKTNQENSFHNKRVQTENVFSRWSYIYMFVLHFQLYP